MKRFYKGWQAMTDRAAASAGEQSGIGSPGARQASGQPEGLAPEIPIEQPKPTVQTAEVVEADGRTAIYGLPATTFTGGFIVSQGEFNPKFFGSRAVQVYEEMLRGDTQVDATMESVYQPIRSAKWDLVFDEEGLTSTGGDAPAEVSSTGAGRFTGGKKREILEKLKSNLFKNLEWQDDRGNWYSQNFIHDVIGNALLQAAFGCAAYEEVYAVDGAQLRFARLVDLPQKTFFQWDVAEDGRTLRNLVQLGWRKNWYGRLEVPAEKMCWFTYRQQGADFWGRAMLRAAYSHWWIKQGLYRIDAIAGERTGMGIPCVVLPPNASREDKEAALTFVTQLAAHEKTGVRLPNGATFDLVAPKGQTHDLYQSIVHHNEQISRCALNFFADMGRGGRAGASGNRSLGQTAAQFFWLCLQNFAESVASRITNTSLRRWVYFNYGPGAPVPQLKCSNVVARSFAEVTEALAKLAGSGLVVSFQEARDFILTELGLPQETRTGIVAIKGETIDLGSGEEISGKSGGTISTAPGGAGPEPITGQGTGESGQPGAKPKPAPQPPQPAGPPKPVGSARPGRPAGNQKSGVRSQESGARSQESGAREGKTKASEVDVTEDDGWVTVGIPKDVSFEQLIGTLKGALVNSKVAASDLAFSIVNRQSAMVNSPRATPSTFWVPGDPEHLRNVHPHEAHVDFPGHHRVVRNAEADIARELRGQHSKAARAYAEKMAKALKVGKKPTEVTFEHDGELESKIKPVIDRLYSAARAEVKKESGRLGQVRHEAWRKGMAQSLSSARRPAGSAPSADQPGLIAEIAVQDYGERMSNAAKNSANDLRRQVADNFEGMSAGEIADELFGAISNYSDGFIDPIAAGASRSAFREGRDDEFQQIADELERQGVHIRLIRVSAREKASCDSCLAADGEEVEPGEDISAIHEGPPETCECEVMEAV